MLVRKTKIITSMRNTTRDQINSMLKHNHYVGMEILQEELLLEQIGEHFITCRIFSALQLWCKMLVFNGNRL